MGEIDVTLENYFKKKERVADVCNLAVGAKLFKADTISELSGDYVVAGRRKNSKYFFTKRCRDIFRSAKCEGVNVRVGIENQMRNNLIFPFRMMEMDYLEIRDQIRDIQQKNRIEIYTRTIQYDREDDAMYHYRRENMIDPVMSIMLYWGKGKWNAPVSIREMQNKSGLPNNVVSCLSDYIVHVINVREITQEEMAAMESDLKHVIALLKVEDDKEAYRRYIMENREYFENVPDSTIMLIDVLLKQRMKQMLKSREERENDEAKAEQLKKKTIEGEERFNMCALDELIKDGYDSGYDNGVNEGEERLGKLSLNLINANKLEELKKVVTDKEYRESLFEIYGI